MIPRQLEAALREAIHAHADRYTAGQLDLAAILAALGNLAGAYLADIERRPDSDLAYASLGVRIAREMRTKRRTRPASSARN
jgi:hypothetical protein